MKRMIPAAHNVEQAFTLIELLVVIAIIGILAGLLLPALSKAKTGAKKKIALSEEVNLVSAISAYYAQYSRLPASTNAVNAATAAAGAAGNYGDFTFGTMSNSGTGGYGSSALPSLNIPEQVQTYGDNTYQNDNSEVIAILRDDTNFWPEGVIGGGMHIYNPQQTPFFNAKVATDTVSPGIGTDDVFRDPWGSPYMVTLDLNYDNKCFDYTLNQLYQQNTPTPAAPLFVPASAIVWSLGPLKTFNLGAGQGLNNPGTSTNKQTIITSF